jgi:hypothetical protein
LKRAEGTDIVARFRQLAPPAEPISIQRWSTRRIMLTAATVVGLVVFVVLLVENIRGYGFV